MRPHSAKQNNTGVWVGTPTPPQTPDQRSILVQPNRRAHFGSMGLALATTQKEMFANSPQPNGQRLAAESIRRVKELIQAVDTELSVETQRDAQECARLSMEELLADRDRIRASTIPLLQGQVAAEQLTLPEVSPAAMGQTTPRTPRTPFPPSRSTQSQDMRIQIPAQISSDMTTIPQQTPLQMGNGASYNEIDLFQVDEAQSRKMASKKQLQVAGGDDESLGRSGRAGGQNGDEKGAPKSVAAKAVEELVDLSATARTLAEHVLHHIQAAEAMSSHLKSTVVGSLDENESVRRHPTKGSADDCEFDAKFAKSKSALSKVVGDLPSFKQMMSQVTTALESAKKAFVILSDFTGRLYSIEREMEERDSAIGPLESILRLAREELLFARQQRDEAKRELMLHRVGVRLRALVRKGRELRGEDVMYSQPSQTLALAGSSSPNSTLHASLQPSGTEIGTNKSPVGSTHALMDLKASASTILSAPGGLTPALKVQSASVVHHAFRSLPPKRGITAAEVERVESELAHCIGNVDVILATTVHVSIADYDTLWEAMPFVMKPSVRLFNDVVEKVANYYDSKSMLVYRSRGSVPYANHGGYHLVLFRFPQDAIQFAANLHTALMLAPWPEQLIQVPRASGLDAGGDDVKLEDTQELPSCSSTDVFGSRSKRREDNQSAVFVGTVSAQSTKCVKVAKSSISTIVADPRSLQDTARMSPFGANVAISHSPADLLVKNIEQFALQHSSNPNVFDGSVALGLAEKLASQCAIGATRVHEMFNRGYLFRGLRAKIGIHTGIVFIEGNVKDVQVESKDEKTDPDDVGATYRPVSGRLVMAPTSERRSSVTNLVISADQSSTHDKSQNDAFFGTVNGKVPLLYGAAVMKAAILCGTASGGETVVSNQTFTVTHHALDTWGFFTRPLTYVTANAIYQPTVPVVNDLMYTLFEAGEVVHQVLPAKLAARSLFFPPHGSDCTFNVTWWLSFNPSPPVQSYHKPRGLTIAEKAKKVGGTKSNDTWADEVKFASSWSQNGYGGNAFALPSLLPLPTQQPGYSSNDASDQMLNPSSSTSHASEVAAFKRLVANLQRQLIDSNNYNASLFAKIRRGRKMAEQVEQELLEMHDASELLHAVNITAGHISRHTTSVLHHPVEACREACSALSKPKLNSLHPTAALNYEEHLALRGPLVEYLSGVLRSGESLVALKLHETALQAQNASSAQQRADSLNSIPWVLVVYGLATHALTLLVKPEQNARKLRDFSAFVNDQVEHLWRIEFCVPVPGLPSQSASLFVALVATQFVCQFALLHVDEAPPGDVPLVATVQGWNDFVARALPRLKVAGIRLSGLMDPITGLPKQYFADRPSSSLSPSSASQHSRSTGRTASRNTTSNRLKNVNGGDEGSSDASFDDDGEADHPIIRLLFNAMTISTAEWFETRKSSRVSHYADLINEVFSSLSSVQRTKGTGVILGSPLADGLVAMAMGAPVPVAPTSPHCASCVVDEKRLDHDRKLIASSTIGDYRGWSTREPWSVVDACTEMLHHNTAGVTFFGFTIVCEEPAFPFAPLKDPSSEEDGLHAPQIVRRAAKQIINAMHTLYEESRRACRFIYPAVGFVDHDQRSSSGGGAPVPVITALYPDFTNKLTVPVQMLTVDHLTTASRALNGSSLYSGQLWNAAHVESWGLSLALAINALHESKGSSAFVTPWSILVPTDVKTGKLGDGAFLMENSALLLWKMLISTTSGQDLVCKAASNPSLLSSALRVSPKSVMEYYPPEILEGIASMHASGENPLDFPSRFISAIVSGSPNGSMHLGPFDEPIDLQSVDVWMLGMTLWHLATGGVSPYSLLHKKRQVQAQNTHKAIHHAFNISRDAFGGPSSTGGDSLDDGTIQGAATALLADIPRDIKSVMHAASNPTGSALHTNPSTSQGRTVTRQTSISFEADRSSTESTSSNRSSIGGKLAAHQLNMFGSFANLMRHVRLCLQTKRARVGTFNVDMLWPSSNSLAASISSSTHNTPHDVDGLLDGDRDSPNDSKFQQSHQNSVEELHCTSFVLLCDLLHQMLQVRPADRITIQEVVKHPYFHQVPTFVNNNSVEVCNPAYVGVSVVHQQWKGPPPSGNSRHLSVPSLTPLGSMPSTPNLTPSASPVLQVHLHSNHTKRKDVFGGVPKVVIHKPLPIPESDGHPFADGGNLLAQQSDPFAAAVSELGPVFQVLPMDFALGVPVISSLVSGKDRRPSPCSPTVMHANVSSAAKGSVASPAPAAASAHTGHAGSSLVSLAQDITVRRRVEAAREVIQHEALKFGEVFAQSHSVLQVSQEVSDHMLTLLNVQFDALPPPAAVTKR